MSGAQPATVERGAAAPEAAALNGRAATAKSTAAKDRAAASEAATMKGGTATSKAAAATETAASATVTAMPASDLNHQFAGNLLRCRRGGRIDQRQRLGALARQGQRQQSRQPQGPSRGRSRAWDLESSSSVKPPRMGDEGHGHAWPALGTFTSIAPDIKSRDGDVNAP